MTFRRVMPIVLACGFLIWFAGQAPADEVISRIECVCRSDRITVFVNGKQVNEVQNVFPSAGKILLQCEGSEVFFRKVELHPLAKDSPLLVP